jgi:hypothetical protein
MEELEETVSGDGSRCLPWIFSSRAWSTVFTVGLESRDCHLANAKVVDPNGLIAA